MRFLSLPGKCAILASQPDPRPSPVASKHARITNRQLELLKPRPGRFRRAFNVSSAWLTNDSGFIRPFRRFIGSLDKNRVASETTPCVTVLPGTVKMAIWELSRALGHYCVTVTIPSSEYIFIFGALNLAERNLAMVADGLLYCGIEFVTVPCSSLHEINLITP